MENENRKITLIRKKPTSFVVNPPIQINGVYPKYQWNGTKGAVISKKEVPYEVYEWLRDNCPATFTDGELFVEEIPEDLKEYTPSDEIEREKKLMKVMPTEKVLVDLLSKGNHLSFKKELTSLEKDLDEDQINELKKYVYKTYVSIGIDSNAKIKALCTWAGYNYEDVKDIFENE